MKKQIIVMCALMTIGLSSCSKDKEEDIMIGGNGIQLEGVIYPDYVPEKEFRGFVSNYVFQFYFYSLSNQEIEADTRAVLPPRIFGDDSGGKWLEYCPTSFYIKDNELYCSAQMDWNTYERWEEYAQEHKIALYVHSTYQYDETNGSLKTDGHIMPAEKQNLVYRMGLNGTNMEDMMITLHLMLDNPLLSDYDGVTEYHHMHINYKRVSLNYPFDTELKVFDSNEEAVAYAKELMD